MTALSSSRSGFSLVEITLAIGIMAFCLLAIFGLVPIGLNSNQNTVELNAMSCIASDIVSDLRSTPATTVTTGTSPRYQFQVPAASGAASTSPQTLYFADVGSPSGLMGAGPVTSGTGSSRYRASVGFTPPGANLRKATMVRVFVTRPALADRAPSTWPTKYAGSFEVVTALDRN